MKSGVFLGLAWIAFLSFLVLPAWTTVARAAGGGGCSPCSPSTDGVDEDGLKDCDETGTGVVFSSGLVSGTTTSFPACAAGVLESTPARNLCVRTSTKDMFFFVAALASGSNLASAYLKDGSNRPDLDKLLEPVYRSTGSSGLGIAVHRLIPATGRSPVYTATNRALPLRSCTTQKGVWIQESSDTSSPDVLAITTVGSPNTGGFVTLYSTRVKNSIDTACATANVCKDNRGVTRTAAAGQPTLYDNYIKHVATHEAGHSFDLRYPLDPTYGEHYPTGEKETHTVLEQSMYKETSADGGTVTFYISFDYQPGDPANALLK